MVEVSMVAMILDEIVYWSALAVATIKNASTWLVIPCVTVYALVCIRRLPKHLPNSPPTVPAYRILFYSFILPVFFCSSIFLPEYLTTIYTYLLVLTCSVGI